MERAKLKRSCSPAPARSTGFAVDAVGGSSLAQRRLGRLLERLQLDPTRAEQVARDRSVAAAVADDRDAPAAGPVRREQRLRGVDELPRRLDEVNPAGTARRLDGVAAARQRARVRAGGTLAGLAAAHGEEDDRLPGGPRRLDERAAVAEVLAVDADHPRPLVPAQRGDELGRVHVGLIADRDRAREAEADVLEQEPRLEQDVAALRDEADRPRGQRGRGELELGRAVDEAEAVRPHEHRPRRPHALDERLLARARRPRRARRSPPRSQRAPAPPPRASRRPPARARPPGR